MCKDTVGITVLISGKSLKVELAPDLKTALEELKQFVRETAGIKNFVIYMNGQYLGRLEESDSRVIHDSDIFNVQPIVCGG